MHRRTFCLMAGASALSACGTAPRDVPLPEMARARALLAAEVARLGRHVDPQEAVLLANVAYARAAELKRLYQVEDPPLIHNTKVNMGLKPRGLCYHWADDMEERLRQETFATLDFHRAIANSTNWRIEHSTVIVSASGAAMRDGLILDPWRKGGELTWLAVPDDPDYIWVAREEVFAMRRRQR